jgi:hypothetical protein
VSRNGLLRATHYSDEQAPLESTELEPDIDYDQKEVRYQTRRPCTSSEYQSFIVKHWGDGTLRFQNEGSGQCVEAGSGHDVCSSTSCDSSQWCAVYDR